MLMPSWERVLSHVSNVRENADVEPGAERTRFPFPVCSSYYWGRPEVLTGESRSRRSPCCAVMENSRGASPPRMSNPRYFISGFFRGKIIYQLRLYLKWLLQGKLAHMQKLVPVALPVAGKEPQGF